MKRILQCFQIVSGLKINFGKSSLYGWNETELETWAGLMGCKLGELPIQYLGASIGINPRRKVFWKPLLEKFDTKLATWKHNSLNQAGRRILVKACLNSLPTYWFQLYRVPKSIINQIDRKWRNFFWGDKVNNRVRENKLHLVKWSKVCMPKHKGGLELDNLLIRNSSLLFKWWWRWFSERNGFWWEVIKQKYQLTGHQGLNQCGNLENMSYIMRDICAPHKVHQWSSVFIEQAYRWILGNGENILFWEDVW